MLSVVYTLCQKHYGIIFNSLSCVLSVLPLYIKRRCATEARSAVNDFSQAILPRRIFIDILMSLHLFPMSGLPAFKIDFLCLDFFPTFSTTTPLPNNSKTCLRNNSHNTSFSDFFQLSFRLYLIFWHVALDVILFIDFFDCSSNCLHSITVSHIVRIGHGIICLEKRMFLLIWHLSSSFYLRVNCSVASSGVKCEYFLQFELHDWKRLDELHEVKITLLDLVIN